MKAPASGALQKQLCCEAQLPVASCAPTVDGCEVKALAVAGQLTGGFACCLFVHFQVADSAKVKMAWLLLSDPDSHEDAVCRLPQLGRPRLPRVATTPR